MRGQARDPGFHVIADEKIGLGDSVEQKSYANRQAMALRGEKPWLGTADVGGYGNLGGYGKRRRVTPQRTRRALSSRPAL
jgi:hypothetical protein